MTPAVPVEGKPVDLVAISAGAYDTYSWDLDGDEVYDDATGSTTRQILPPGTRTIGVRATDQRGVSSTERRSISAATNFPPTIAIHTSTRDGARSHATRSSRSPGRRTGRS